MQSSKLPVRIIYKCKYALTIETETETRDKHGTYQKCDSSYRNWTWQADEPSQIKASWPEDK